MSTKVLHYNLYQNGNIGMNNLAMSIENALLIGKLTERDKIIFYGDGRFFNSENKSIRFDALYDINFPYEWIEANEIDAQIPAMPYDFHDTVLYHGAMPSDAFINKRSHFINLEDYKEIEEFRTKDANTLAFYSYLFYFTPALRQQMLVFIKDALKPKQKYVSLAEHYVKHIDSFNSIHFRRGDFLRHANTIDRGITAESVIGVLKANFQADEKLLIHTDEEDLAFFSVISKEFPSTIPIEKELDKLKEVQGLDIVEIGLISMLIASKSKNFIGTMESTYTSMIQRYRIQNGLTENFKYLYPKHKDLILENGRFKEDSFGEQSWNRIKLPEAMRQKAFWFREWPESYMQKKASIKQSLQLYPNFMTTAEIEHIIARSKVVKTEVHANENRDRWTVHVSSDQIIADLIKRACEELGYVYDHIEPDMQIFIQHEHGQTGLHTDSLYENYQGKRISSVLFYLNDEFTGSKITFPYIGTTIEPKSGMMIAYPLVNEFGEQDKRWAHAASVITKGTKYMCYFSLKEKPFNKG